MGGGAAEGSEARGRAGQAGLWLPGPLVRYPSSRQADLVVVTALPDALQLSLPPQHTLPPRHTPAPEHLSHALPHAQHRASSPSIKVFSPSLADISLARGLDNQLETLTCISLLSRT